jgi:hypothetical protein
MDHQSPNLRKQQVSFGMIDRARPNSPAQIFLCRKEVRARLMADRLSIDPVDRRQHAGKIAIHLASIEP